MALRLVNWNVEWATPRSRRTPEILSRIGRHAPEVICLTETHERLLSGDGYTICSQADYGYGRREGRRKVLLWSPQPWEQVDDVGSDSLPPGRFVSGVTQTSVGRITVTGVCIPWSGSRTKARLESERKLRWEDHERYLAGLAHVLGCGPPGRRIVMGDFNQVIGCGSRAGRERQAALQEAFAPSLRIATSALAYEGRRSIDHIALSEELAVESLDVIGNIHEGSKLSDHFGVVAELSVRPSR